MKKNKKESHLWGKGKSGNPNGRPRGPGKPVSPLRKILSDLEDLKDRSLENIAAIVKGTKVKSDKDFQEVDKQMLETSKWVISTISSMSRAATQDEQLRHEVRSRAEDKAEALEESKKEATTDNVVRNRFTLDYEEESDED